MADNLIPVSKRTKDEAREISSKGGKKSGEARRQKRDMKQKLKLLLSLPATGNEDKEQLKLLGIDIDDADNEMLLLKSMFLEAASGNVQAFKEIRSLMGMDATAKELQLKERELRLKEKQYEEPIESVVQIVDDIK